MIIWFDRTMTLHVDKMHDANNSFALAKYIPCGRSESEVVFKANAVVNGHTLLLTHTQVTTAGAELVHHTYCSYTTARKYFFRKNLSTIENSIKNYLRGIKGYTGEIKLRFRVGSSTVEWFNGYTIINTESVNARRDGYWYATYVVVERKIQ